MKKPTPGKKIQRKSGFFTITQYENQKEIDEYNLWVKAQGYVYIASSANPGTYKIGFSRNLIQREMALRIGNPGFKIILCAKSMDCRRTESEIHKLYENQKISGEWFDLSDSDLSGLCRKYGFTTYDSQKDGRYELVVQ